MSIKIQHATKCYAAQKAVDDICFEVSKGSIVGFLGPNGAGKSTTMKMITGYLRPDEGRIEVSGIEVNGESIETKKKIGYLPEHNPLYPEMYVREYLKMIASIQKVADPKKKIEEIIEVTGLTKEAHKEIGRLSKGYKQRAGLAAAIIHDPEVLILDEPTTGLDPNQIIEIRGLIRKLGADKTILFSTHILQEVEAVCDHVIIINKGKIVADGSMEALKSKQNFCVTRVTFSGEVKKDALLVLPGIQEVIEMEQGAWNLKSSLTADISKELMSFALQHNVNIVSLQSQTRQLEEIFRQMTSN